jgi:hypothetical protein
LIPCLQALIIPILIVKRNKTIPLCQLTIQLHCLIARHENCTHAKSVRMNTLYIFILEFFKCGIFMGNLKNAKFLYIYLFCLSYKELLEFLFVFFVQSFSLVNYFTYAKNFKPSTDFYFSKNLAFFILKNSYT